MAKIHRESCVTWLDGRLEGRHGTVFQALGVGVDQPVVEAVLVDLGGAPEVALSVVGARVEGLAQVGEGELTRLLRVDQPGVTTRQTNWSWKHVIS